MNKWKWNNCGKEEKKYRNLNISMMKRAFLMKKKTFLIVFEGLLFGKKKIEKKNGHKL